MWLAPGVVVSTSRGWSKSVVHRGPIGELFREFGHQIHVVESRYGAGAGSSQPIKREGGHMILWLDFWLFGNGHGLKSPHFDDVFYWQNGRLYTWNGWYGSQLQSFQWRKPKPGETRFISGREFVVSERTRKWFRVRCTWRLKDLPRPLDGANVILRELQNELNDPRLGRLSYKQLEKDKTVREMREALESESRQPSHQR